MYDSLWAFIVASGREKGENKGGLTLYQNLKYKEWQAMKNKEGPIFQWFA